MADDDGFELSDYPEEWITDVVLSDGSTATLRPIKPEDRDLLDAFHNRQSKESIYFRFFRYRPELSNKELDYFTQIDYEQRMAFVVLLGEELVAVARYETWDSPEHPGEKRAEVAFFVDDAHHGKGLATIGLEFLAAAGRRKGFDGFTATVLPENVGMLRVFRRAGFDVSTRFADGVIEVSLGIEVTDAATAAIAGRARRANARSVARLIEPQSVAVVGASRESGTVGHQVLLSIRDGGFVGKLVAVNPNVDGNELAGVPALPRLSAAEPGSIDLVIVAVPVDAVESVLDEAIAIGAAGLLVVSVGFSDAGEAGAVKERALVERARANGLRVIGPNSFGMINTAPDVLLDALFVPVPTAAGSVGLLSQSGPLGAGLLAELDKAELGVSTMIAVGNRADVSVNDLLQYWTEDERTDAIALYLENYGNLRNFVPIARELSMRKAVIAVAPADPALADVLRHAGVCLVDRVAELVDQVEMVVREPLPAGNRVVIVSNASSVARLAASACAKAGLNVVAPEDVGETTVADVVLVGDADTLALPRDSDFSTYEEVLVAAAVSPDIDAVLVALVPTPSLSTEQLADLLTRVDRAIDKPMAATGLVDRQLLDGAAIPVFTFPEEAARALGRSAEIGVWRRRGTDALIRADDAWAEAARSATTRAMGNGDQRTLDTADADLSPLLEALDLPVVAFDIAMSADDAVTHADRIGYPVVLKAGRLDRRSAGEAGGAALDLQNEQQLRAAFDRMAADIGPEFTPAVVQRMRPGGQHIRVDLIQDPDRGSRLELGVGGITGAALGPLATAMLPTSEAALDRLLAEPWVRAVIDHQGGAYALRDLLSRLATAADACANVAMVSCNPVLIHEAEIAVVDVSITLQPWSNDPLAELRHLD